MHGLTAVNAIGTQLRDGTDPMAVGGIAINATEPWFSIPRYAGTDVVVLLLLMFALCLHNQP